MQFMYDDDIIPRMAMGKSITMRTKERMCDLSFLLDYDFSIFCSFLL